MAFDFVAMICEKVKKQFAESGYEEICAQFTSETVMVPMSDGVRLKTFVYRPVMEQEKFPVILMRTCYPNQETVYHIYGECFAKRGYVFALQYSRGRGGSEGLWEPNINERKDGIDMVDWLLAQPWCDCIGCWGHSYSAMTGWATADAVEGKVASMFLQEYGCDRYVSAYEKGAFRHDILTSWSMENAGKPVTADYLESCQYMPQSEVDEKLWGQEVPSYRQYISNAKSTDDLWQSGWWKQLREIPGKTKIPMMVLSGWYDHHHGSSMKTWERLSETAKAHSWLVVGGWNHFFTPCLPDKRTEQIESEELPRALEWFDLTLKKKSLPEQKVRYYEIGEDTWHTCKDWKPEENAKRTLYLQSGGAPGASGVTFAAGGQTETASGALTEQPPVQEGVLSYTYDPNDPLMSTSGEGLLKSMDKVGSLPQPPCCHRGDVLSFVSDPLEKPLAICGSPSVNLFVATDGEDTAFTAKLMEVTPQGKAYHIRSSITTIGAELLEGQRYEPGSIVEVSIDMWDIAYTVKAGSRIRVDISSSDFPLYNIHSNYAGLWSVQTSVRAAKQTVRTGGAYPSCVSLPVADA